VEVVVCVEYASIARVLIIAHLLLLLSLLLSLLW
jgi:hypothetical protein